MRTSTLLKTLILATVFSHTFPLFCLSFLGCSELILFFASFQPFSVCFCLVVLGSSPLCLHSSLLPLLSFLFVNVVLANPSAGRFDFLCGAFRVGRKVSGLFLNFCVSSVPLRKAILSLIKSTRLLKQRTSASVVVEDMLIFGETNMTCV